MRLLKTPVFVWNFFSGSRAASDGGAWKRRAATVFKPRSLRTLFPCCTVPDSIFFWVYFVILM